jgi:hypothetical protein
MPEGGDRQATAIATGRRDGGRTFSPMNAPASPIDADATYNQP